MASTPHTAEDCQIQNSLVKTKSDPCPRILCLPEFCLPLALSLSGLTGVTTILVSQEWYITPFQSSGSSRDEAPSPWTAPEKRGFHNNVYSNGEKGMDKQEHLKAHKDRHAFLVLPWLPCSQVLARYLRSLWVA